MAAASGASRHDGRFPRAWLGDSFDFSFSGLKTAARRAVGEALERERPTRGAAATEAGAATEVELPATEVAELAWAFQDSVVDVLATKTLRAARDVGARDIVLGGGVAANSVLRERDRRGCPGDGRAAPRATSRTVHGQRGHDRRGGAGIVPRRAASPTVASMPVPP